MLQDLDLIVNLYNLPDNTDPRPRMEAQGIYIKRAVSPDKTVILNFIKSEFSQGWADEAEKAIFNCPSSCYIAVHDHKVVGFACYDSVGLGYYGPLGVAASMRKRGIGEALTSVCLSAMREKGYGYIIINAGPVEYYIKHLNACIIGDPQSKGDHLAVYNNMICN